MGGMLGGWVMGGRVRARIMWPTGRPMDLRIMWPTGRFMDLRMQMPMDLRMLMPTLHSRWPSGGGRTGGWGEG